MSSPDFKEKLSKRVDYIENILGRFLPEETGNAKTLEEAMNYSVTAGGKRLRPMLVMEAYKMFAGVPEDEINVPEYVCAAMAAIECLHNYSLVHDDLPAMDNDEYRRGRLTTWKVYGDAMGVLAGDGLLNYAFEILFKAADDAAENDPEMAARIVKAGRIFSEKAGFRGMIGGQCADLEAEGKGKNVTDSELIFIHEHKTACLIEAALMMGAVLGGADRNGIRTMEECGHNVGIAFQIQDDYLDVYGDFSSLGKSIGSDAANGKVTYVTLCGPEKSLQQVATLSSNAEENLKSIGKENKFLEELIMSLIKRNK